MRDYEDNYDDVQDWTPEEEFVDDTISLEEYEQKKCPICNSIILEDGTAEDCLGECDLDLASNLNFDQPLDFS